MGTLLFLAPEVGRYHKVRDWQGQALHPKIGTSDEARSKLENAERRESDVPSLASRLAPDRIAINDLGSVRQSTGRVVRGVGVPVLASPPSSTAMNSRVPGFAEHTHPVATKNFRDLLRRIAATHHFGVDVFEVGDALKPIYIFNSRRLLVHHFWRKLE